MRSAALPAIRRTEFDFLLEGLDEITDIVGNGGSIVLRLGPAAPRGTPEPGTLALFGSGAFALAFARRRRQKTGRA